VFQGEGGVDSGVETLLFGAGTQQMVDAEKEAFEFSVLSFIRHYY
jgi:hypothetical protein